MEYFNMHAMIKWLNYDELVVKLSNERNGWIVQHAWCLNDHSDN